MKAREGWFEMARTRALRRALGGPLPSSETELAVHGEQFFVLCWTYESWNFKANQINPFISIRPLQALLNCQKWKKKVKLQSQTQGIITCKSTVVAHSKAQVSWRRMSKKFHVFLSKICTPFLQYCYTYYHIYRLLVSPRHHHHQLLPNATEQIPITISGRNIVHVIIKLTYSMFMCLYITALIYVANQWLMYRL